MNLYILKDKMPHLTGSDDDYVPQLLKRMSPPQPKRNKNLTFLSSEN